MPKAVVSSQTFMESLGLKGLLVPLATAFVVWGAAGGFPKPPLVVQGLLHNELFQYFLVFIFVWQGGAQQNIQTALIATVILFLVSKALDLRSFVTSLDKRPSEPLVTIVTQQPITMPPLTSAAPAATAGTGAGPLREGWNPFQKIGAKVLSNVHGIQVMP